MQIMQFTHYITLRKVQIDFLLRASCGFGRLMTGKPDGQSLAESALLRVSANSARREYQKCGIAVWLIPCFLRLGVRIEL